MSFVCTVLVFFFFVALSSHVLRVCCRMGVQELLFARSQFRVSHSSVMLLVISFVPCVDSPTVGHCVMDVGRTTV